MLKYGSIIKYKSVNLFLKNKTIAEYISYYQILKNYCEDPVDGLLWSKAKQSKAKTKKRKRHYNDPIDNFFKQSQNPKIYYVDPADNFYEQ